MSMRERFFLVASAVLALTGLLVGCGPVPTPTSSPEPTWVALVTPTLWQTQVTVEPAGLTPTTTLPPIPAKTALPTPSPTVPVSVSALFAPYRELPVTVRPAVAHEPLAPDLSNVISTFLLSAPQREALAQNGFVVSPSEEKEFYMLYEKARYNFEPTLITSDSLLHVYHLLFDKVLRTLEREQMIPMLKQLNARMLETSQGQYEAVRGTSLEDLARHNVAFFAVGSRLLDPSVEIPPYVQDLAEAELALIEAHDGVYESPIFPGLPYGEDYSQYIPRGHYTLDEDLQAYFRAMTWYGRMTFRVVKPQSEIGREETRRALLIVQALARDSEAASLWQAIYEPTVFFVGRSDDLTYSEYLEVMIRIYGGVPDPVALDDEGKLTEFMQEVQQLRPPRILGIVIYFKQPVEETTKGFRFMGQRFTPDSYIFRQLVYRNVGELCPPERRGLPKGLDLLAVMGSERAYEILEEGGDTDYISYTENMASLQGEFAGLAEDDWTQNLYWSWLYTFFPLLEKPGEGYPAFMQSPAWLDKSLNTILGSWAELRHDTILYAKQAYAEMGAGGKGPPPDPEPPKSYVEAVPRFYARLAALAAMTRQGLQERDLLNAADADSLRRIEELALALKGMAEKELAGRPLTEEEYERIRFYGGELEHLTFAAADGYQDPHARTSLEEEPQAAVVADVATDPDPNCDGWHDDAITLEEAVGRIFVIYAVVPIEGELVVVKGGVFSYYEFLRPTSDRLTDEAWREMLDAGQSPPLPEWTASYRVDETEEFALGQAVWGFTRRWTSAAWEPSPSALAKIDTTEALNRTPAYLQSLLDQGVYEGHHLVRLAFLSFDLQDAGHAIVTTRETWWAERYLSPREEWQPGTWTACQPEYTVGVTYRLEQIDGSWQVRKVLIQGEIPAWQAVWP